MTPEQTGFYCLKLDVIDKLEENNSKSNIEIDPRWDKLKALITENK